MLAAERNPFARERKRGKAAIPAKGPLHSYKPKPVHDRGKEGAAGLVQQGLMPYVEDGGGTNRNHEDADHKHALGCKASRSEARIAEPSVGTA